MNCNKNKEINFFKGEDYIKLLILLFYRPVLCHRKGFVTTNGFATIHVPFDEHRRARNRKIAIINRKEGIYDIL